MRTFYLSKAKEAVAAFIQELPTGFSVCLDQLKTISATYFDAIHFDTHPIAANIDSFTERQLRFIIQDYSAFSNDAIHR